MHAHVEGTHLSATVRTAPRAVLLAQVLKKAAVHAPPATSVRVKGGLLLAAAARMEAAAVAAGWAHDGGGGDGDGGGNGDGWGSWGRVMVTCWAACMTSCRPNLEVCHRASLEAGSRLAMMRASTVVGKL